MLDPIVRAAAHPSRAILDAPAPRYRLSEIGNVTANGQLAFSGDAAVVAAGAALELSEQTISVRRFGLSRSSTHTGTWSLAPSLPRVSRSTPTSRRRSASEQNVVDAQAASAPAARPWRASSDGKEAVGPSACSRTIRRQRLQCANTGHSPNGAASGSDFPDAEAISDKGNAVYRQGVVFAATSGRL
jgi:hypothetical protein